MQRALFTHTVLIQCTMHFSVVVNRFFSDNCIILQPRYFSMLFLILSPHFLLMMMKACSTSTGGSGCRGTHTHHMLLKHRPITGIFRSPYHLSVLLLLDSRGPPGANTDRWVRGPAFRHTADQHHGACQITFSPLGPGRPISPTGPMSP